MYPNVSLSRLGLVLGAVLACTPTAPLLAQATQQCFVIEFFYDSSVDEATEIRAALDEFAASRGGLDVNVQDVAADPAARERLDGIAKYFRLEKVELPAVYGLKYIVAGIDSPDRLESRLREILVMTAFVRKGCPHCNDAKAFLAKYADRYPALEIVYREVTSDKSATPDMQAIAQRYNQRAASLPVLHFCNGVSIGFDSDRTTGARILQSLDYWCKACPAEKKSDLTGN